VIARNEEAVIEGCLKSLRNQTIELVLVVVNDGSSDRTAQISLRYADMVVNLPRHEENWGGQPELARIFNAGFNVLKDNDLRYVLISGSDSIYPPSYVQEVIGRMRDEGIVLASGTAKGEVSRSLSPRGSGRIVDARWFRTVGFRYPENYGFEVYPIYKALSEDRKVSIFSDLTFTLSRGTVLSNRKAYLWGKGMRALNYWWLYAFGRAVLVGLRHPSKGLALLKGYVSHASEQYEDIKEFVPLLQKRVLIKRVKEILEL